MESATSSSLIQWPVVVIPGAISFLGVLLAVFAAHLTAKATVRGARQQAIETEAMKLRYSIAERRVAQFDDAAVRLLRLLKGYAEERLLAPSRAEFLSLSMEVAMAAHLVASFDEDQRSVMEAAADTFLDVCRRLPQVLEQAAADAQQREPAAIGEAWAKVYGMLHGLQALVDECVRGMFRPGA